MRAALLGVHCDDLQQLRELAQISSWITHTDPRATEGALAVALAAHYAFRQPEMPPIGYYVTLQSQLPAQSQLLPLIERAMQSAQKGDITVDFAEQLGLDQRVSGFVLHTVPVALHAAWRYPHDFESAILAAIDCGGDTDSVAAIVGGVVGARVGRSTLPHNWLDSLAEWPYNEAYMDRMAHSLCHQTQRLKQPWYPVLLGRNLVFLVIVLGHGFRRLFTPY